MSTPAAEILEAIELTKNGNWHGAHEIAQRHEGHKAADWLHAVLHKIEGDLSNAKYWYHRAGKGHDEYKEPNLELAAIKDVIG